MTASDIAKSPWSAGAFGAVALLSSYGYGAERGLAGMGMGLAGAAFGCAALWLTVRLIGSLAAGGKNHGLGLFVTFLAFGLKVPLYLVLWGVAQGFGGDAPSCFVAGVVLVYFLVVARASAS